MNKRITGVILTLAILLVIPLQGYAATPKETIETGVNNLLKTLGDPAFKAQSKDQQIATIGTEIEHVFDFKELSRRESTGSMTYIYTKSTDDTQYSKIEIPVRVSDMEISTTEESVYLTEFNGINSSVLQLYPDGSRQIAVVGFYNPLDIEVNKYDASLIISDTGNGAIWHYDQEAWFIGRFTNLYLPGKVTVE